jgi:ketosteroid isomerase-like protein
MELHVEDISGDAGMAYAWGRGSLSFSYQDKTVDARHTFVNVLRKQADGTWKTVCRMWSDARRP